MGFVDSTPRLLSAASLAAAIGLAVPGCRLGDGCDASPVPPLGSVADYHFKPGTYGGVKVEPPAACPVGSSYEGHFIAMQGGGARRWHFRMIGDAGCSATTEARAGDSGAVSCPVANLEAFLLDVRTALDLSGIPGSRLGFGDPCSLGTASSGAYAFFWVGDWGVSDRAVEVVVELTGQWGIGESVGVLVSGAESVCAN